MSNIRKLEAELWESADLFRAGSKLTSKAPLGKYCDRYGSGTAVFSDAYVWGKLYGEYLDEEYVTFDGEI